MAPKRLRCFVVGCNNEHNSRHVLPTSELLKMQWINVNFVFERKAPILICLNASLFTQIFCDPASTTDEVSIRVFYESLQITFPDNVLVSMFHS